MLKNLKLWTKLNLLLLTIVAILTISISLLLSYALKDYAKNIIVERASILLETMTSVRNYTSTQIRPELASRLEEETLFIPQTVPAYSAREVFDSLRKNGEYSNFFYKEATLNPTNLRDKADRFEAEVVNSLRTSQQKQTQGFRSIPAGDLFYIARPIKITKESCLQCHGIPEDAPKSQLATYGDTNGFGWKMDEVVGAQVISVPAWEIIKDVNNLRKLVLGVVFALLLPAILLLNLFLKFLITNPLDKMSGLAKKLSTGDMDVEFDQTGKDEIGILASSLNRLKVSLKMAMDMIEDKQRP